MLFKLLISRKMAAGLLALMVVGAATAIGLGLTYSEPVASGALGPDWQCTRLAFIFTSCTRVVTLKTAAVQESKALSCLRPKGWRNALGMLH